MARPLRIEYPGAWYHVMNRGSARQHIFFDLEEYNLFLDLLSIAHQKYEVEFHAYCLMSNHYYLLIHTKKPNLNKVMQYINGVFTQKVNRMNKKDGSLFRGRYKSILIEADSYLLNLSRYIHMNPVIANIVKAPEEYDWSSYNFFLSKKQRPHWIYCNKILDYFENSIIQYREFVLQGIDEEIKTVFERKKQPILLGSKKFTEVIKKENVNLNNKEEQPQSKELQKLNTLLIEDIVFMIERHFGLDNEKIKSKWNKVEGHFTRNLAIYLALKITGKSQKDIGKKFGITSYARVSQICKKMRNNIEEDRALRQEVSEIEKKILKI